MASQDIPRRSKRCFYFDDQGRPRVGNDGVRGCHNTRCLFAHPSDPEWVKAAPTLPPNRLMAPEEQAVLRTGRERPLSPTRNSSVYDSSSRSKPPPPSLSTTSRYAPNVPRASLTKEPSESSSSWRHEREPSGRDRSPVNSVASADRDPRERARADSASLRRSIDRDKRDEHRSSPRPRTPSMPPPPAAKTTASVSSVQGQPSHIEKTDAWVQRIKSLADAVMLRAEYLKIEQDIIQHKRMQTSVRYADVSEQVQTDLHSRLLGLEEQWDVKKRELNTAVYRLIDSDFWFVTSPTAPISSEEKFRDLRVTVWELRDNVKELFKLAQAKNSSLGSVTPTPSLTETVVSEQPPAKRPRLDEDVEEKLVRSTPASTSLSATTTLPLSTDVDMDAITERFDSLEDRINTVENNMVQYDNDLFAQMEDQLHEKLTKLELHGMGHDSPDDKKPPDTGQDVTAKLEVLQQELTSAGEDIEALVGEIATLIGNAQENKQKVEALRAENETMKQRISQLETEQAETRNMLNSQKAQLDALSEALASFVSRPPQVTTAAPDTNALLQILSPPLRESVRQGVQPLLTDAERRIEQMLAAQSTELSTSVLSKIMPTVRAVQAIKTWMDSIVRTSSAPPLYNSGAPVAIPSPVVYPPNVVQHPNGMPMGSNSARTISTPSVG